MTLFDNNVIIQHVFIYIYHDHHVIKHFLYVISVCLICYQIIYHRLCLFTVCHQSHVHDCDWKTNVIFRDSFLTEKYVCLVDFYIIINDSVIENFVLWLINVFQSCYISLFNPSLSEKEYLKNTVSLISVRYILQSNAFLIYWLRSVISVVNDQN
jgi:hypothetical protein